MRKKAGEFDGLMIRRLSGKHKGKEICILGNGPSLSSFPTGLMKDRVSIGVNRILRQLAVPNYLMFLDHSVWQREEQRILSSNCSLVVGAPLAKRIHPKLPKNRYSIFTYNPDAKIGARTGPIHQANCVGYYATELACRMIGFSGRIILAGMDLAYPEQKAKQERKTHFFGDGRREGCNDRPFAHAVQLFQTLASIVEGVDFRVCGSSRLYEVGFKPY